MQELVMGGFPAFSKIKRILYSPAIFLYLQTFVAYYSQKYKPLIIRKNTSDMFVFRQVFVSKCYDFPIKKSPKLIIDAGAYTGYSVLWFRDKYPDAQIVAIEPEESNFRVLEKNTRNYEKISRIKAGLWHRKASLKIRQEHIPKYGQMTDEAPSSEGNGLRAITLDEILGQSGHDRIDILKIDIEGAEKELFSENYESWLGKVDVLIIELHERKKEGCTKSFREAIKNYSWDEFRRGENLVLVRKSRD
jgi:FkbM family methyltransferase